MILGFFVVYATVRIFMNKWYWVNDFHYLTPLYSPCINESCVAGFEPPGHLVRRSSRVSSRSASSPSRCWPASVALATTTARPATARCSSRRPPAQYRSRTRSYTGERKFPLVALNLHRYFFYGALVFGLLNVYDGVLAFHGKDGGFGIGLGTLIIWINLVFLWLYTLSCHACRHIVGGRLKNFSKHPLRYRYWTFVSKLNPKHGTFAMISLFTVILTDAYIMSLSAGWFSDLRFFN